MAQLMPLPLTVTCFSKIQIGFTFLVGPLNGCSVVVALVLQQNRLRWYGHVLRKDDDWVKKCMEYEVEGPRPRGNPKRTWRDVVKEDCLTRKLKAEDATDRSKWRKLIKDVRLSGLV